ncbi:MAG: hypothetical protein Q7R71_01555 [bacterium]|nr:hypothetical protein [bacterium]
MGEMLVIAAFLLVWFGLAALGGAMNFTHILFAYPTIAAQRYSTSARRFWVDLIAGPSVFLACLCDKRVRAIVRKYGLWVPSASARAKAMEIADDAHREAIEKFLRKFDAPEEQKQTIREVWMLLKDHPERDPRALLEALAQKPPEGFRKMH